VVLVALGGVGVWAARSGEEEAAAELTPHNGRFHVDCDYSHSAPDDPIVFPGEPGASHQHDFFGASAVDAWSDTESLLAGDTTCEIRQDTAAYWAPSLFDGERQVEPLGSTAYYRAAAGVDPGDVVPFPTGLVMISGDSTSTSAQPTDWVGWACRVEAPTRASPPDCGETLLLRVIFPDCWDGEHLDSADHREHVARSGADGCPGSHPVALPQLEFHVRYPAPPPGDDLRLASGSLLTAHADFFNAWQPDKLAREVEACIGHDAYC
jgi:Domain of unknown function (DUF1996)